MDGHLGASIQPCPWLNAKEKKVEQFPRYLRDVAAKRTVHVKYLQEPPQYITISHTWGRWRMHDRQPVKITGVPWPVPVNTRFRVEDLPNDLQRLPFSHPYVWFDLLCIPQDGSQEADIEISKQAQICARAASSVVWLNNVKDWKGLENAIHWMIMGYLKEQSSRDMYNINDRVIDNITSKIINASPKTAELLEILPKHKSEFYTFPLSGWFNSLWTLQEVCLRPDMLICSRNWEILTVNSTKPVALDTIIALQNETGNLLRKPIPGPIFELYSVLIRTGLEKLLTMSQQEALALGEQRYCEARRAEAIMSVLGMTEWFNSRLVQLEMFVQDDDLLFEKYPISFVNEVKRNLGAAFFCGVLNQRESFVFDREDQTKIRGTMLPFAPIAGIPKFAYSSYSDQDHFTIKEWEILPNGSVRISRVAVVASTQDSKKDDEPEIFANLVAPLSTDLNGGAEGQLDVPLHHWLQSFHPELEKHAVCLAKTREVSIEGIILMQTPSKREDFVKIGWFTIFSGDHEDGVVRLKVKSCNWRVL